MTMDAAVAADQDDAVASMPQLIDIDVSRLGTEDRIPGAKPSADRRRTLKRKLLIEAGFHPTGLGKIDRGFTCGQCANCISKSNGNRSWWKCKIAGITHGAGTDIRLSWPSCPRFGAR